MHTQSGNAGRGIGERVFRATAPALPDRCTRTSSHREECATSAPSPSIALATAAYQLSSGTCLRALGPSRSEEHTSELQSLMRISYAVFCLKKETLSTQPNLFSHPVITGHKCNTTLSPPQQLL